MVEKKSYVVVAEDEATSAELLANLTRISNALAKSLILLNALTLFLNGTIPDPTQNIESFMDSMAALYPEGYAGLELDILFLKGAKQTSGTVQ